MKKILTLSAFFLLFSGFAQNIQWITGAPVGAYQDNTITGFYVTPAKEIFLSGKGAGVQPTDYYSTLYKIDDWGNILYKDTFEHYPANALGMAGNLLYMFGNDSMQKIDAAGGQVLSATALHDSTYFPKASNAVVEGGSVYATDYYNYLVKYDLAGNMKWQKFIDSLCVPGKIKYSQGYLYVYAVFYHNSIQSRLLKYDTLGNLIWNRSIGAASDIIPDDKGNYYLVGTNQISKLDSMGQVVWSAIHDSMYFNSAFLYNDTLLACGGRITYGMANPGYDDMKSGYAVYSPAGQLLNTYFFNLYTGMCSDEQFNYICKTGNDIYIAGRYCSESYSSFVLKISDLPLSVFETGDDQELLSIFPNPSSGSFSFRYTGKESDDLQVKIYDTGSQLVYSEIHGSRQKDYYKNIDLSRQAPGLYFVIAYINEKKITRRIILD